MKPIRPEPTKPTDLSWLSEVSESRQPLSESQPVWLRFGTVPAGPAVPYPEWHPYCEFGTTLDGVVVSFVGREQSQRLPGDLFLAGPGVPHWAKIVRYPLKFVTAYFLPSVLIQLAPEGDGLKILRRFTAHRSLAGRLVRPADDLRERLLTRFQTMVAEFEQHRFGREIRLQSLLMEQLVELLRWEEEAGRLVVDSDSDFDWKPVDKALHYLREHFAEPVYAQILARVAGVSESRLKTQFRHALGMSWVNYLQGYRIHRAAALLSEGGVSVTEAALATGFESLSHFNATFRSFMGVAPTVYRARNRPKTQPLSAPVDTHSPRPGSSLQRPGLSPLPPEKRQENNRKTEASRLRFP
jgi:AraC-like DNA-binding protein